MVNLFFLKTFVEAAKTGSLQRTARNNHITQPAVTQHLRVLEEKLGCLLFERRKKRLYLTPAGRTFLAHAQGILARVEEAYASVSEIGKRASKTIRIATIYSIGLYSLGPRVREFLKIYPDVNVRLEYHPFDRIYRMAADHEIDFGFVAFPEERPGIHCEVFHEDRMVLCQSKERPLFPNRIASWGRLHHAPFVAFAADSPTRIAVDNHLASFNCLPRIENEYDNVETLKSAISLGIGCSIIPDSTLQSGTAIDRSIQTVSLKGLHFTRPLGMIRATDAASSETSRLFRQMLLKKS